MTSSCIRLVWQPIQHKDRQRAEFYRYVFGSDFDLISTFGEGPPDIGMSDDERDRYAGPDGSQIRREDT